MFFSRSLLTSGKPLDSERICSQLGLPRSEYGSAITEWYTTIYTQTNIKRTIVNLLTKGPLNTNDVLKSVSTQVPSGEIISALYRLSKEGTVLHHYEEGMHTWELNRQSPVSPFIVPVGTRSG